MAKLQILFASTDMRLHGESLQAAKRVSLGSVAESLHLGPHVKSTYSTESNCKACPKDHLASASGIQKPRNSPWRHDAHMGFPVALLPTHSFSSNQIHELCTPPNASVLQLQEFGTVLSSQHKLASAKASQGNLTGPPLPDVLVLPASGLPELFPSASG